jgi:tyrosine-protein kinase Etk/Wzc
MNENGMSLAEVLAALAKHKKLLMALPAAAAAASAVICLLLPDIYTARTTILPPQQNQSTSALLAQLGSLAASAGSASMSGLKNPNDLYVGMLKSRTVADSLIERFDLNRFYAQRYPSETRKRLEKKTTIVAGKDGIITVEVDDGDPKRAAALANGYVEELFKLTKVLAVTEASQRRLFFERQLEEAKDHLARAEVSARLAMEKGGLVQVEGQGRALLDMSARLRAQITVKDVQIGAMRAFATAQNPELLRHQQELEAMKRELARIEGNGAATSHGPTQMSEKAIGNLRLLREMKYYEATYELLAKQLEFAKIDEARDSALIQVLDKAIEPDRSSKPLRLQIVLLSTLLAAFFALASSIVWEAMRE